VSPLQGVVVRHLVSCNGANVTAVRTRIEFHLGCSTKAEPQPWPSDKWAVYFDAPEDVDLDFLQPDVLPPR
jgi:hypothetical protein